MTGKIPKLFINELLLKTNIIDLIKSKIPLKKKGNNYQAKCPFHKEKTPSFIVNYEKQFYHCFGCNSHGNAIDFLMNYNGLKFIECIEELSILNNINIPYKKSNEKIFKKYKKRKRLYKIMKNISYIYHKNFNRNSSKKIINYIKKRGIKKKIINLFLIGYSNLITLKKILYTQEKIFNKKDLLDSGVININYSGLKYDRFNNRIIFPIRDRHGRINGFGGRLLKTNKNFPKYINSPETKIFHKKKQIYGLYEIYKKKNNFNYLIVVEGYFDVILLTQFKIKNSISILGTSLTTDHLKILFNITKTIIFCYDGDKAGKNASWNALIKSLPYLYEDRNIKFILLPKNEDPDSIIKKEGTENFKKRIKKALYMSEYLFKKLIKKNKIFSIEKKKNFIHNALSLINTIPSKTYKFFLYKKLGEKIGITDEYHLNNILKINKKKKLKIKKEKKYNSIKVLISLIIQNPHLYKLVLKNKKIFKIKKKGILLFLNIIKKCKKNKKINTGILLEQYRKKKEFLILKKLAKWNNMINKKKVKQTFLELFNHLQIEMLKKKMEKLILKEKEKGLKKKEKIKLWLIKKKIMKKQKKI
ncbi:MAG: DNA primase [Buchnera aphidicola (Periphyllus lyropictus)]|uniref:DNA primase n=1 Tax=Buchnera aphidicola TaxID=9 RepID=UPI001ED4446E|nr:DNA primase [Buchnera aphidicola]NIH16763.1 DNA primase [Buchnera aphidicola (Periphyllus lyropictus)]USS94663.1 DNA primase [Buchnera aphidicola (Periphyllus lyropictus)]